MSKLYTNDNLVHNYRSYKALIAAKYSGKSYTLVNNADNAQEKHFYKLPALECSDNGNLFENNAIAYHLANDSLRGTSELNKAEVVQWLCWAQTDLWPSVFAWILPALGLSNQKQTMEPAKNDVKNQLKLLNKHLLTKTFLVGERITLADVAVGVTLLPLYQHVLEQSLRDEYQNVTRYFLTLINQKNFADVIGKVELCSGVKRLTAESKCEGKKPTPKKDQKKPEEKKQQPAKKSESKPVDDGGDDDDLMPAMPKPKDPFEKFPKGTFDMDDFKRFYSNNPEEKSIPYFWTKFDKDNYSIWFCEYKYPEELTQVFMSCNLISGMFQRLDRMRKNAFSSMLLFGEDNNSTISGVWVWRGHELAFPLSDDWTVDYESYDWKKLNPDEESTKKLVEEYFSWSGQFGGKKFNQGKIFK
ncbi:Elongation factor 1-gamma [Sarcoptes scabiei]|uniref:eEF-1B gamma n=1 Tax=Sarcoptes scabiei TaxID=52283 RepID=A0A132AKN9_SARSC|nr:Elongation factor 1-gamma [Sarcoptes scabiei]KPM11135.1 elongation factor 1-gamma-like protein [Sarcoptes scabiei]